MRSSYPGVYMYIHSLHNAGYYAQCDDNTDSARIVNTNYHRICHGVSMNLKTSNYCGIEGFLDIGQYVHFHN